MLSSDLDTPISAFGLDRRPWRLAGSGAYGRSTFISLRLTQFTLLMNTEMEMENGCNDLLCVG
jgi:hypothetical protein